MHIKTTSISNVINNDFFWYLVGVSTASVYAYLMRIFPGNILYLSGFATGIIIAIFFLFCFAKEEKDLGVVFVLFFGFALLGYIYYLTHNFATYLFFKNMNLFFYYYPFKFFQDMLFTYSLSIGILLMITGLALMLYKQETSR
jgi:hypothetical protein